MGKHPSVTIAIVAVAGVTLVIVLARPFQHRLNLRCYFQNAQGLRAGARVRLAGVEVGSVTSVRVRPELRDHPAEVTMFLQTAYQLNVPNDSVVVLESEGVLGDVFAEIDIRGASGPPVLTGGVLNTRSVEAVSPRQLLDCFSNVVEHKPCDLRDKGMSTDQGAAANSKNK